MLLLHALPRHNERCRQYPLPYTTTLLSCFAPAVPAEDGGDQGEVRQVHPVVVPPLPAEPLRRGS